MGHITKEVAYLERDRRSGSKYFFYAGIFMIELHIMNMKKIEKNRGEIHSLGEYL